MESKNQCRPKREASKNSRLKTSLIIQDEVSEQNRKKWANW